MTTEAEPTLAGEFPPATEEQWLALVDKVLKGAPLSKLESRTPGGITVEPLYTATVRRAKPTRPVSPARRPSPAAAPRPRVKRAAGASGPRSARPHPATRTALRCASSSGVPPS